MVLYSFSHRARLMESTDPHCSKWYQERKTATQTLLKILCTNIARRNTLNILSLKYLMAISKLHKCSHRSIKNIFSLCLHFHLQWIHISTGNERELWMFYVFYIDWVGLFNSIAAYRYLEVLWKSFQNRWAEAIKTKIIDCFSNSCRQQNN